LEPEGKQKKAKKAKFLAVFALFAFFASALPGVANLDFENMS
jgi:hypothetical protein